jgi:hypothetical protein
MRSDRQIKLKKRKEKLGEKFTSDWTWRKFSTEQLSKLNPMLNFHNVDSIYEIGCCNGHDDFFDLLTKYIANSELHKIQEMNQTLEYGEDGLGTVPIGEYLKTFIWILKDGQCLVQVVKGAFDIFEEKIVLEQNTLQVDIEKFASRKLVYPVD